MIRAGNILTYLTFMFLVLPARVSFAQSNNGIYYFDKTQLVHDIEEYKAAICSLHVQPFDFIGKKEFVFELDELIANQFRYDVHEVLMHLQQINAKMADEHTKINFRVDVFPYKCYWFDDGLYIIGTPEDKRSFLYSKITAINGVPILEVLDSVKTIIPNKNEVSYLAYSPQYMFAPYVLHGLGLLREGMIVYSLVKDNKTFELKLQPEGASNADASCPVAMCGITHSKNNYAYEFDSLSNSIYFRYSNCHSDPVNPFKIFTEELIRTIRSKSPDKIIIDLRDNRGGHISLLGNFIKFLSETNCNYKKVYVIIGRKTFSAAVINAIALRNKANAILVGEETSGSVSHYGMVKTFTLPNTHMELTYSTKRVSGDMWYEGSLKPDVTIPITIADYRNGQDVIIDFVKRQ